MSTSITPNGGHVTLRGHAVAVDSDVGRAFAVDCVRFIENLIDETQLRKKYALLNEEIWRQLETNEPLQLLVGKIREERLRDGTAQREKASLRWNSAIDVVDAIVQDPTASAKHRLDGARELRACATGTEDSKPDARERFTININFGTSKLSVVKDVTPVKHDEDDDMPEPRVTGIVNYTRG
jgi:hypothetical protein